MFCDMFDTIIVRKRPFFCCKKKEKGKWRTFMTQSSQAKQSKKESITILCLFIFFVKWSSHHRDRGRSVWTWYGFKTSGKGHFEDRRRYDSVLTLLCHNANKCPALGPTWITRQRGGAWRGAIILQSKFDYQITGQWRTFFKFFKDKLNIICPMGLFNF